MIQVNRQTRKYCGLLILARRSYALIYIGFLL
nr:MAG TPA: hypothetical protein [Caudoviricetes sp.]